MYISLNTNQYDINNVMISEKTKNNIMQNGDFYRLYYSTEDIILNGLHISFELKNISIEKYFNKIKCIFENNVYNNDIVNVLKNIEKKLLARYNTINRTSISRIAEQLEHKYIKIFDDNYINIKKYKSIKFVLKVSGIWSSQNEFGLTFRFFLTPIIED
jgi:hypothetical protein|uniref:Uncharacterized protein n=1 Tax=viral metagenome TaxID=1070528 RepID=A0A6C0IQU9_9ZZZZ